MLKNQHQLGVYPMQHIRRVESPTNLITPDWQRVDQRETAFFKAMSGQYGEAVQGGMQRHAAGRDVLSTSLANIAHALSALGPNDVVSEIAPIPRDPHMLSRHVKRLGYFLGGDIIGICSLHPSAVYKLDMGGNPVEVNYKYAIVILNAKEYRTGRASDGRDWITDPMSLQAYRQSAMVAITMADYIRRLGYPALAQYGPINYKVQMPPLILMAGLGEVSRVGIILNPFLGLNYKAAAVLTDMPLLADKPLDFGLQDFCSHCGICAERCPSQAIARGDKALYNGYETWKLNTQRCASFVLTNKYGSWCNICVKVCPWSRPYTWNHSMVRWAASRSALARRIAVKYDSAFGHKGGDEEEQWWFDLPMENGKIVTPPASQESETQN
jgi:reductive dehalogenase